MAIRIEIHPTATTSAQCSLVQFSCANAVHALDIDFTSLLSSIPQPAPLALDLLFIAACVYGVDKAVPREKEVFSEDKWKRHLDLIIPVGDPGAWGSISDNLSECLSFLTGDAWSFKFETANRSLVQRRRYRRRRFRRQARLEGEAVSLFSGGLDSFIGAVDSLAEQPKSRLALIGHYDGDVGGPSKDQDDLAGWLEQAYSSRFTRLKCRVGLAPKGVEHSYRSRSFLFLALGIVAAESISPTTPVIIPENGPIALNPPLIPSRRGACSTRTAHPHFLLSVEAFLRQLGFQHEIRNPYECSTKGEIIEKCKNIGLLEQSYGDSRSCAKAGYKMHWKNKQARQCGLCIPCLFRRAALHKVGWDNERFGNDVNDPDLCCDELQREAYADVRALSAFLLRNLSSEQIRRDLVTSGPILAEHLESYVAVVQRMRDEVRAWMAAKANRLIRASAGLKAAK